MSRARPAKAALDGYPVALQTHAQVLGVPPLGELRLREAVTHPSWVVEHPGDGPHNQRLEFLGDAVLGMLVVEALHGLHGGHREGTLSRWKAELVSTTALAAWAASLGLGAWLRLGRGEEMDGGRERQAVLADLAEALIAAVYLEHGLAAVRPLVHAMIAPRLAAAPQEQAPVDPKSQLQMITQHRWKRTPTYSLVGTDGPDHDRTFEVEVRVSRAQAWTGRGKSRQAAEQAAASLAIAGLAARTSAETADVELPQ